MTDSLPEHDLLIFTGPIDAYFASKGLPKLEYRSIFWEKEYLEPSAKIFQPAWVRHTILITQPLTTPNRLLTIPRQMLTGPAYLSTNTPLTSQQV